MRTCLCAVAAFILLLLPGTECRAQSGWKPDTIKIGTISNLWGLEFVDGLNGVVVGDTMVRTTDGGRSWQSLALAIGWNGERWNFQTIHCFTAQQWSAVSWGTSFLTTNAGASWIWDSVWVNTVNFRGMEFVSGGIGMAVGHYANIATSSDGGAHWTTLSASSGPYVPNYFGVAPAAGGAWIVVGGNPSLPQPGIAIRSTDGGARWDTVLRCSRAMTAVSFPTPTIGYAAGDSIYGTTDGGASWQGRSVIPISVSGMSFKDPSVGTIVGSGGKVCRTRDGARTWIQQTSNTNLDLRAVCFTDTGTGWAVGYRGIVLRTTNGGWGALVAVPEESPEVPRGTMLLQNYPNPFNPRTMLSYHLAVGGEVRLALFDILGREVAILDAGRREAGTHEVALEGSGLSSGVYLYRLQVGGTVLTRRCLLLR
jgi:photosystem II stability/assembly factor-like uncharacterized protein